MKATLIKVYTETDSNTPGNLEMFRVYKTVDLLIDPKSNHKITLEKGSFFVNEIEQNLKENKLYLYEYIGIPHYEFWRDEKAFTKKYLPKLLKEGWKKV